MAVSETAMRWAGLQPLTSRREGTRHEQDPERGVVRIVNVSRAALAGLPASSVRGGR